jgi:hypothetical protein
MDGVTEKMSTFAPQNKKFAIRINNINIKFKKVKR